MGTRNLTCVKEDGKYKVAQYGQWDGCPEGQGVTILNFLNTHSMEIFKEKLKNVRFFTDKDNENYDDFIKNVVGSTSGLVNMGQSKMIDIHYPYLNRDVGGEILSNIFNCDEDKTILLRDKIEFARESLFCEYCYVIDLDKNTFEIFEGFNRFPLKEDDRFYYLTKEGEEYEPVKLIKEYSLDNLPTKEEFLKEMDELQEEDDE